MSSEPGKDTENDDAEKRPEGPFFYENWKEHLAGVSLLSTYEVALYTDAHITGAIQLGELGPYSLLNSVPMAHALGKLNPSVVLRYSVREFDPSSVTPLDHTDDERYHSGGLDDEIAALVSLFLGVRMWAGPTIRAFYPNSDPKGRPMFGEAPTLAVRHRRPLVPRFTQQGKLGRTELLAKAPSVAVEDARVLVRAARLYQQAAWLADSEPHLAWLSLVSAVEAAADRWFKGELGEEALLRKYKADLVQQLEANAGGAASVAAVAKEFGSTMKATAKFLGFLKEHMPEAPNLRPPEHAQLSWTKANLGEAIETVYKYRSRALHDGRPFPHPMSEVPDFHSEWAAPDEIPTALAMGINGGQWLQKDTPMRFHMFEYIARNALLKWWECVPTIA